MFTCSCGKDSLTVTPYGEMNLCVVLPIPNYDIRAGDVASGWRSLVNLVQSARPSEAYECPRCTLRPYCNQDPMNAWVETGDLNPCLPYFKELAALEKHAYEAASSRQHREGSERQASAGHNGCSR